MPSGPLKTDQLVDYYEENADAFFSATVAVDMSSLHAQFAKQLPEGGHILDAGCGSGRDALAFSKLSFRVTAFDASPSLARLSVVSGKRPVRSRSGPNC